MLDPPAGDACAAPSPQAKWQAVGRGVLAATLFALALFTLRSFLPALAWAAVFAVAIWPLYHRVQTKYPPGKHNVLVPLGFTLAVALLFHGTAADHRGPDRA